MSSLPRSLPTVIRPLWLAAALGAAACSDVAQRGDPDEPDVGQPGPDVIWVATAPALVDRLLDIAKVTDKDFLIDLGSGDGEIVIAAAKRGARALGVEYNAELVEHSRRRAREAGVGERAQFVRGDLFAADLSEATVVALYLTEQINLRLRPKLLGLKPGTRILSNTFGMGEWLPDETVTVYSFRSLLAPLLPVLDVDDHCHFRCSGYLWNVPADVAGLWRTHDGTLEVRQRFQELHGELVRDGQRIPLWKMTLRGRELTFAEKGMRFSGRVEDEFMRGVIRQGGGTSDWTASRVH
jgi:SAM-dependent methyltransferase